jgi:hypothetical protein
VSIGRLLRDTMVWKACTIWQATGTGSTPLCGSAACAPLPRMVILNSLLLAIIGPALKANWPTFMPGQLCMPKMASIGNFSNSPSRIISRAPPPPSSAGWNTRYTCRRSCGAATGAWPRPAASRCGRRGRRRASCRGACWRGRSGCARSSAARRCRRAGPPRGSLVPFLTMPTTPVVPMPRCTGMPQSVSALAIRSAVRASWKHSSGWAWMSRRSAVMVAASARMDSIICMAAGSGRWKRASLRWRAGPCRGPGHRARTQLSGGPCRPRSAPSVRRSSSRRAGSDRSRPQSRPGPAGRSTRAR